MDQAIGKIVQRHREMDAKEQGAGLLERERQSSWPTAGSHGDEHAAAYGAGHRRLRS
jgi:hypothetical protein